MKSRSLAARARDAVRDEPFLYDALRAGVLNYTAAARYLDVEGEQDAVATAVRRYADDLPEYELPDGGVRVSMKSGVGSTAIDSPLLTVGDVAFGTDGGGYTAIVGAGSVDVAVLQRALARLGTADVEVVAAGVSDSAFVIVVERRVGANALRAVEAAVEHSSS